MPDLASFAPQSGAPQSSQIVTTQSHSSLKTVCRLNFGVSFSSPHLPTPTAAHRHHLIYLLPKDEHFSLLLPHPYADTLRGPEKQCAVSCRRLSTYHHTCEEDHSSGELG